MPREATILRCAQECILPHSEHRSPNFKPYALKLRNRDLSPRKVSDLVVADRVVKQTREYGRARLAERRDEIVAICLQHHSIHTSFYLKLNHVESDDTLLNHSKICFSTA